MSLLFKNKVFYPYDYQKSVFDIDYRALQEKGVKLLMIDLDNTLIPYDESEPNDDIRNLFAHLKEMGFKIIVISNSRKKRVEAFANALSVKFVSNAMKPLRCGFRRAQALYPAIKETEVAVIGDQFMTDVLGGNRCHYLVVVVDAIKRQVEKWYTRINRRLEKRVLSRIKKADFPFFQRLKLDGKR
ncbi:MAG: YqeG family HAD IIIA-type phosphatase [Acholeplasmataceae bacterium]|nr:YqeG family HAD IIIA-type phosphatase [Acholeplasmataceae bacterium]